jgi:hypothetical protein
LAVLAIVLARVAQKCEKLRRAPQNQENRRMCKQPNIIRALMSV